ncbi:outer membrane beta-barrel protein [Rapidithrix thailandica]|uniref:Outer membrane beta-barrel protein n=1 Tax=Rapidithrix thailandica TaxID=413964 RepID=A0AAW9S1N7_9BACT
MNRSVFYALFLFWIVCTHTANAQEKTRNVLIELGVGPNAYKGELSKGYEKWASAFHAALQFNRSKKINFRLGLRFGHTIGQDLHFKPSSKNAQVNTFVKTNFWGANMDVMLHLLKKEHVRVYLSQGLGLLHFAPKDAEGHALVDQTDTRDANETYSLNTAFFPTSLGIAYHLDNNYGASLQFSLLNPFNDYLDNISQWGNSSDKDNILSVRLSFLIPLYLESKNERALSR